MPVVLGLRHYKKACTMFFLNCCIKSPTKAGILAVGHIFESAGESCMESGSRRVVSIRAP